jgi:hypothetical protein
MPLTSFRRTAFSLALLVCVSAFASEGFGKASMSAFAETPLNAPVLVALEDPGLEPMELAPDVTPKATVKAPPEFAAPPSKQEPLTARAVVVDINSNTLNYDEQNDVYVATGAAHVVISEQNSELTADKVTYDQKTGMMIAEGHVVITKNGQKTEGTYAKIDLNRQSALISDAMTTVKAVRIKAERSFVNSQYIELENGKFIISGQAMAHMQRTGGLQNVAGTTGKKANQARLKREYYRQLTQDPTMMGAMSPEAREAFERSRSLDMETLDFSDDKASTSRFRLHAKEIEIRRGEDGYDEIDLKWPSLYMGRFKIATMPHNEFSYDEESKVMTYLGPDIGANPAYGGAYLGPGWDFRLGRGAVRFSPIVSLGDAGFQTTDGKNGEAKGFGPGFGGMVHFRDPDTTIDLAYNSRVGTPVMFADRRLIGENVHLMAAYNDFYTNGLIGQMERPNYIAQLTDYRVLKQFKNVMVTSFESIGWARDNFNPTNRTEYFVNPTSSDPTSGGRVQLQAQIQNVRPLIRLGDHVHFGLRGQVALSGYTSGDMLGILRGGPTMNVNFKRFNSQIGYFQTMTHGESPFVFDAYFGGARNVTMNNFVRVNEFLSVGLSNSFNLQRDNATNSLAVGNTVHVLVGPKDVKMNIGYDFISKRSSFGINYFPGSGNSVIGFDKLRLHQPENYSSVTP